MERRGIRVDRDRLRKTNEGWQRELLSLRDGPLAGINPASNPQVGKELRRRGFTWSKRTKGGQEAVDMKVLEGLQRVAGGQDDFLTGLLEYRQLSKLVGTYGWPLLEASGDGRVHGQLHQMGTETGRFSSSKPNLQNIPARTERGKEVRRCFVASEGMTLVKADYSQIELRVLAAMSRDSVLMEAFRNGEDIHQKVADMMGVDRRTGKQLNFGVVYGMEAPRLAGELGMSTEEATELLAAYWRQLPGVRKWKDSIRYQVLTRGYVETWFGRRKRVHVPEGAPRWRVEKLLREAGNMPPQGTAAELTKLLLPVAWREARDRGGYVLLQVHDELLSEVPTEEAVQYGKVVKRAAEEQDLGGVPVVIEVHVGENWEDCHGDI